MPNSNPYLVAACNAYDAAWERWRKAGMPASGSLLAELDAKWRDIFNAPFADGTRERAKLGF